MLKKCAISRLPAAQAPHAERAQIDHAGAAIQPFGKESVIVVEPAAQILEETLEGRDDIGRFKEAKVGAAVLGKFLQRHDHMQPGVTCKRGLAVAWLADFSADYGYLR